MNTADFWNVQERAQKVIQQVKELKSLIQPIAQLEERETEISTFLEMGDDDSSLLPELRELLTTSEQELEAAELKSLLSGPNDTASAP